MVGMKFHVVVTMEKPIVWHAARLHFTLLLNLAYNV